MVAKSGDSVYRKRFTPHAGSTYASVIAADGKLYCVSQHNGAYVFSTGRQFEQLAHNVFEDDNSRRSRG